MLKETLIYYFLTIYINKLIFIEIFLIKYNNYYFIAYRIYISIDQLVIMAYGFRLFCRKKFAIIYTEMTNLVQSGSKSIFRIF